MKNCNGSDEIPACFNDPTNCDDTTEDDKGRSVFSGIRFVYNGGMHPVAHVSIKYQNTYVRNKY
jgi:hypothetical protein